MAPAALNPLEAKRQLSFLATFDKKFEGFRRELERLRRAAAAGKTFGGRWPTEGLERTAKSLIGAGAVYGLLEITEWAREFLKRIDAIRANTAPPAEADLEWLAAEITRLEALKNNAYDAAAAIAPPSIAPGSPLSRVTSPPASPVRVSAVPASPAPVAAAEAPAPPATKSPGTVTPTGPSAPASTPAAASSVPVDASRGPSPQTAARKAPSTTPLHAGPHAPTPVAAPRSPKEIGLAVFICVKDSNVRKKIAFVLKGAGFEAVEISAPDNVLERVSREAPELVVIDLDDPAPWGTVITDQLAMEPMTDYIPVLKISATAAHARTDIILKPIDNATLLARVKVLTGPDAHGARIQIGLKDPTLAELVAFINDEIRQGTLDAASSEFASERFRILNEGRIMSSIWALVGQIRQTAVRGSRGHIRFAPVTNGQMGMMALAEADDVLGAESLELPDENGLKALQGMRAVVADDDPEIRALFSRVLTEAGVTVRSATDGFEAFDSIRAYPPDFIFSDIVMPRMDGWELCNRLRTDYRLRDIPVILLSWKEDFLERIRSLKVNAEEFMLKDSDRRQILARVLRALRPRLVLNRQLGIAGDVTGRIERIGVVTLLESVTRSRGNCNVIFRESWNDFEVVLRDGAILSVTMTGTDGSFASGERAMDRLLGVTGGRFTVMEAHTTARAQFNDTTRNIIDAACRRLNRTVTQITDGALVEIRRVGLNEDVLATYQQMMPAKLKLPLERLASGASPKEIITDGTMSPDGMESLLLDLLRAGALMSLDAPEPDDDRVPIARNTQEWQSLSLGELVRPLLTKSTAAASIDSDAVELLSPDEAVSPPPIKHTLPPPPPPLTHPQPPPPPPPPLNSIPAPGAPSKSPAPPVAPRKIPVEPDPLAELDEPAPLRSSRLILVLSLIIVGMIAGIVFLHFTGRIVLPFLGHNTPIAADSSSIKPLPQPEPVAEITRPGKTESTDVAAAATDTAVKDTDTAIKDTDTSIKDTDTAIKDTDTAIKDTDTAIIKKTTNADTATEERRETREERRERRRREAAERRAAEPKTEERPADTAQKGTLRIELPAGVDGPVTILVDGKPAGRAPTTLQLKPGLHEITFVNGKDRSLRMVSIKEGVTKTVTPSF